VHVATPQFVRLCQLLVREMERLPTAEPTSRDLVLDRLTEQLVIEGLVFDRAFAGQLYDQLLEEPDLTEEMPATIETVRQRVLNRDYFSAAMLDTLGERLLQALERSG
jgi:hypothetical protein